MQERDYQTTANYTRHAAFLPPPTCYLFTGLVSTLSDRISRGRQYERTITPEYLQGLTTCMQSWIDDFALCPLLAVPADDLDYVAHPGHLKLIAGKIEIN